MRRLASLKEIYMVANQGLVIAAAEDPWTREFVETMRPVCAMVIVKQGEWSMHNTQATYELVVIDSTTVTDVSSLIGEVRHAFPTSRIVVMTASPRWQNARDAFEAGAQEYLSKNSRAEKLVDSIRAVLGKPIMRSAWLEERDHA